MQAARWFARYAGLIAPAGRQRVRVSPQGGRDAGRFPRRVERALSAVLPEGPAAVLLFDRHGFARTVVFDLDAKRVGRRQVESDVATLVMLLGLCGVRWLRDGSVSGGQHVYVPLARPRHVSEVGRLLRAAARLLPSLDISLVNAGEGCIRPPGSPHRQGGFQRLLCAEAQADHAFARPAGEEAWTRLGAAVADACPSTAEPVALSADVLAGRSWAPLPDRYERIARTGDAAGYVSGSEARQAVLASAANRGWSWAEVEARVEDGRWLGLRGLYARYRGGGRRALRRDWAKAVGWAGAKSPGSVSGPDTSPNTHRGGSGAATHRDHISSEWISVFLDAVANASTRWGRHAGRNRAVLQSLAYAAWQARSPVICWGVRSYALGGGLGRSTVAVVLAELAAEADPLLVRVVVGVHDQADTYRLRLPETVSLRRAGPTLKPRPVPDVLIDRPKSGLGVYQALSSRPRTADELVVRSRYGRATVYRRLTELAELGLAGRTRDGSWVRGHRGLVAAGWRTGAFWLRACRLRRYRRERRVWRNRLDGWHRPAVLIPAPRPPDDPESPPPPHPPAAAQTDPPRLPDEPPDEPADEDPWSGPPPATPEVPEAMVLELLEEVLGAVPVDEHGFRLYPRRRRPPPRPG